jgi:hypothetical protein
VVSEHNSFLLYVEDVVMTRLLYLFFLLGTCLLLLITPASGDDLTTDDYIEFWKPVIGKWKMTSDAFGRISTGTFQISFSPNRKCLLLYHGTAGEPFVQQLQGYDPVGKKQIAFGFSENGNFQIQTITVQGMRKGMKAAKDVGGDWEAKVFSTDGTTSITTCKWKWAELEKDRIVIVWFDTTTDGEAVPGEMKMTLEREE